MKILEKNKILLRKAKVEGVEPVYGANGLIMTYDKGKILPAEWYDGDATQEAIDLVDKITSEEHYNDHLRIGLPRSEIWEAKIDMSKIDKKYLVDI